MILIAIGSNLKSSLHGMPEKNCSEVIKILRKYFFVVNVSNFYKTEPIPKSNQPWYVNAVIEIKTNLDLVIIVVNKSLNTVQCILE